VRVIGGSLKGRRLAAVRSSRVRPTTDKVREAIFAIMTSCLNGGTVLDLFAGTGSLGIEAVSRGMDRVVFIENDSQALLILKKNIHQCDLDEQAEIISLPVSRGLRLLVQRRESFHLIFLDPPYGEHSAGETLTEIGETKLVAPDGFVIAEHSHKETVAEYYGSLVLDDQRRYGQTRISFFSNKS